MLPSVVALAVFQFSMVQLMFTLSGWAVLVCKLEG
jgi:hypothetical protein